VSVFYTIGCIKKPHSFCLNFEQLSDLDELAACQSQPLPPSSTIVGYAKNLRRLMAIKKSELYSSLWSSRDELPGGMDASQHKDYVLVPQLTKYVNKKYVRQPFAPINIPSSASLANMVAST